MPTSPEAGVPLPSVAAEALLARLPLTSADPFAARLGQLHALFPEAQTDGRFDLEKLRALAGDHAAAGPERYGLSWAGKSDALKALRQLTTATLLPAPSESVNWDTTGHALIEGDNLEVLKVLQRAYYGKVKLIYIDPPYNTGGDFIYPDDYAEGLASYLQFTRQVRADGAKLTTNVDTGGRYHSRWLTMMFPRLFLARNLLREDGVIFVSIDDHEVHNLRLIMDEIFGEENFVASVIWQKAYAPRNNAPAFSESHEYLLCYARSGETAKILRLEASDEQLARYTNRDNDSRGRWKAGDMTVSMVSGQRGRTFQKSGKGANLYEATSPSGAKFSPPAGRCWVYSEEKFLSLVADNRVWWGESGANMPSLKRFLDEIQGGQVCQTIWSYSEVGHNQEATKELKELFDDAEQSAFPTPKPSRLIKRCLELVTSESREGIVLDFFAGSGSTAHATLDLNRKDGGNRKFILVQLPEPTGRKDYATIVDVTKERVRRVIQRMEKGNASELGLTDDASLDLGFKVFRLAPSNFAIWNPALAAEDPGGLAAQWQLSADNVGADASEQALLHELMLKSSLPLTAPAQPADAAGTRVWLLDDGRLLICLARALTREALRAMITLKPQSLLCLDVGFAGNDTLKVNAQLECQSHGIQFRTA